MALDLEKLLNTRGISKDEIVLISNTMLPKDFENLVKLVFLDNDLISQKAAWLFRHSVLSRKVLVIRNYNFLISNLATLNPDGAKRDVLRGFLDIPLQPLKMGLLTDICMKWLSSPECDVAVKYNSMRILEKIVKKYPELNGEFRAVLIDQLDKNTVSFRKYASQIIDKLPIR